MAKIKKVKIFYHKSDMDGLTSAALIKYYYIYRNGGEAVNLCFHGYDYGEPTEHLFDDAAEYDIVYVADVCFEPFTELIRLSKLTKVVWIDHHRAAILDYKKHKKSFSKSFKCHLGDDKNSKSACELVWDYLFKKERVPPAVRNISLMDTWHHNEDEDILSFYFGAEAYLPDIYTIQWNKFIENDLTFYNQLQTDGRLIWGYTMRQRLKNAESAAFETTFEGFRTVALNTPEPGSHQFAKVFIPSKHDLMLVFRRKPGYWVISIYANSKTIDCSALARNYGGGGHLNAAGFEIHGDTLPFPLEKKNGKN